LLTIESSAGAPADQEITHLQSVLTQVSGRLEWHQHANGSATFILSLPLTLAIIRVMMARVGDEVYAFPIQSIQETQRLTASNISTIRGREVLELRNEALSLLFLREYFDVPVASASDQGRVLIIHHQDHKIGVVVDHIVGIREVVIKPLTSRFTNIRTISGSAILGDEQIALILDAEALVEEAIRCQGRGPVVPFSNGKHTEQRLIP